MADPAAVRRQLERILRSEILVNSERLCRFLRVAVERTLAGETDKLKEWVLAQDVFDRDESYDPRIDSIVRVEARRLRAKLRQYYEKAGPDDCLLIWFRTGSYTALFQVIAPVQKEQAAPLRSETPSLNPRTVAVLPFVNLSPEPGQDFFCDGITEEILNELTTIPDLNVVARTSVFHFKGQTGDVREIAEKLGAGTVIEGSVRKSGSHLRIAAKAIDAATGCHLWSGTFDRQMVEVFAIQDEIARAVGNSLRVALAPSTHAQPHEKDIAGLEAYTLYLKGRHQWHKATVQGYRAAIDHFTEAITRYPNYAPPHAGLADIHVWLCLWGIIPPGEGAAMAKSCANEALRLDECLAEAYAALGAVTCSYDWQWDEGARLLRRSLELQPSYVNANNYYAFQFLARGHAADAMVYYFKAFQLDPLSVRTNRVIAWAYAVQRDYDKSLEWVKKTLELDEHNKEIRVVLAHVHLRQGRYADAVQEFLIAQDETASPNTLGGLGSAYGLWGRTDAALEILDQLDRMSAERYVSPLAWATVYVGLGQWDQVFEWLERAYRERNFWLSAIAIDPSYDPVRSDRRFNDLLTRLQLV